jgi:hypothetical protein
MKIPFASFFYFNVINAEAQLQWTFSVPHFQGRKLDRNASEYRGIDISFA